MDYSERLHNIFTVNEIHALSDVYLKSGLCSVSDEYFCINDRLVNEIINADVYDLDLKWNITRKTLIDKTNELTGSDKDELIRLIEQIIYKSILDTLARVMPQADLYELSEKWRILAEAIKSNASITEDSPHDKFSF